MTIFIFFYIIIIIIFFINDKSNINKYFKSVLEDKADNQKDINISNINIEESNISDKQKAKKFL